MARQDRNEYRQHGQPIVGGRLYPSPAGRRASRLNSLLVLLVMALALLALGYVDNKVPSIELRAYCRNVHAFNLSGGQVGWPDYKEIAREVCLNGKVRAGATR